MIFMSAKHIDILVKKGYNNHYEKLTQFVKEVNVNDEN